MSDSARSPDGYVDWRHGAVCRGEDPELFFPVGRTGPAVERQIAMAKAVCGRCPVTRGCLDRQCIPERTLASGVVWTRTSDGAWFTAKPGSGSRSRR